MEGWSVFFRKSINTVEPIRIFSAGDETVNLLLPLVFISLALVAALVGWMPSSLSQVRWMEVAANIIGFNVIHNFFSLVILALPEVRRWTSDQKVINGRNILRSCILIAVCFIVYFQLWPYCRLAWINPDNKWQHFVIEFLLYMIIFMEIGHGVFQLYGLSVLYNKHHLQTVQLSKEELAKTQKLEKLERILFKFFCYSNAAALTWVVAARGIKRLGPLPYLHFWVGFGILQVAILIVISALFPRKTKSNKVIYQLRLFLIPFAIVSPVAATGSAFTHGLEYLFLYRKVVRNSGVKNKTNLLKWVVAGAVFIALLSFSRTSNPPEINALWSRPWLFAIGGISYAITFLHYWLDAQFFHFSDPITREHILPLLQEPISRANRDILPSHS